MRRVALGTGLCLLLVTAVACEREVVEAEMPAEPMRTPVRTASSPRADPSGNEVAGVATMASAAKSPPGEALPSPPLPLAPSPQSAALATSERAASGDLAAISGVIEAWRAAWQAKDLVKYLEHYDAEFQGDGMDRAAWGAYKSGVFARAGALDVRIEKLQIQSTGERAEARFRQRYASGSYRDSGDKRLELRRRDGAWRIVAEEFRVTRR